MAELLLHPDTEVACARILANPPHALLLIAPNGSGKGALAAHLAARLLEVKSDKLDSSAHYRKLAAQPGKAILIEQIRDVTHFLMLRASREGGVSRVVVIEHAGTMTAQAQNALLKTIEEPPAGTVLILTARSELDILPTVRSRLQLLAITPPTHPAVREHFAALGYSAAAIDKALLMSDGLVGLTHALLVGDQDHPLVAATATARKLLQQSTFERLLQLEELTKDKQGWLNMLSILSRIAEINLQKSSAAPAATRKWHQILRASHDATTQSEASGQIKLVALNFLLSV